MSIVLDITIHLQLLSGLPEGLINLYIRHAITMMRLELEERNIDNAEILETVKGAAMPGLVEKRAFDLYQEWFDFNRTDRMYYEEKFYGRDCREILQHPNA